MVWMEAREKRAQMIGLKVVMRAKLAGLGVARWNPHPTYAVARRRRECCRT